MDFKQFKDTNKEIDCESSSEVGSDDMKQIKESGFDERNRTMT